MPRVTKNDPLQGHKFRVSIPGLPNACGFKKISGLAQEIGLVTYDEGGYKTTRKLKGKVKTGELVCEKGMFANKDVEDVFRRAMKDPNYRGTVTIDLLDEHEAIARTWSLAEAWCSKWEVGDIDSSSEEVVLETITIQYEDFI